MSDRVVVVGASGFGREALDVLEAIQSAGTYLKIVGVVDDDPSDVNLARLAARGVAYLGTIDDWLGSTSAQTDAYVLGVGSPPVRRMLVERVSVAGVTAFTAVHPNATIGSQTSLDEGVVICAHAVISTNVRLGRHVHINPNATVGHDSTLREFVSVNPGAVVSGEVTIEPEVLVGASATILQGLSVATRSVVGACALVTKDVPRSVVVKGVPGVWRA